MENQDWQIIDREFLMECCCSNEQAVEFFLQFYRVMHGWDDLVDKDNELSMDDIDRPFIELFFGLMPNLFYRQYHHLLQPVVIMCINAWRDSTWLEREHGEKGRRFAYILRTYPADVLIQIALITGGYSHMRAVSKKVREILIHLETYEQYTQELDRA
jgi:hypothetical protein